MKFRRVVWIVLDSVGVGAMPDWESYGDPPGSDTLGNIARLRPLSLPNFAALGLGNLKDLPGVGPVDQPLAAYGRCGLRSPGKDTTTGHWEMVGAILDKPFPLFPQGFPPELMREFEQRISRSTIGNKAASGTEIIQELGDQHVRTGSPIVYTSADSVFQIAAHEEVIPLWELYKICESARELLRGDWEVGRVIARPFLGSSGSYSRTTNRRDYAVPPPKGMLLDKLETAKVATYSVGKIFDIFLGRGIGPHEKTKSNADGMAKTLAAMSELDEGLIFTNLVDFDSLYGHRNNVEGYASALEEVDRWLPQLLAARLEDDLIVFTADHGCDPTTPSTDHSREFVPLLALGGKPANLGTRDSLADIGQTVAQNFGVEIHAGVSFLRDISG
ncbi:MAG: phosphopentomutase [Bryobacteraceae bacterium]|nr:phosphopentomutase [Bryobacteraceae bacterium]